MARPFLWLSLSRDGKSSPLAAKAGESATVPEVMPYVTSLSYNEQLNAIDEMSVSLSLPGNAEAYDILELAQLNALYTLEFCRVTNGSLEVVREETGIIKRAQYRQGVGSWSLSLTGYERITALKGAPITQDQYFDTFTKFFTFIAEQIGYTASVVGLDAKLDEKAKVEVLKGKPQEYNDSVGKTLATVLNDLDFIISSDDEAKKLTFSARTVPDGEAVTLRWGEDIQSLDVNVKDEEGFAKSADASVFDLLKRSEEAIKHTTDDQVIKDLFKEAKEAETTEMRPPDTIDKNDVEGMRSWLKVVIEKDAADLVDGSVSCNGVPEAVRGMPMIIENAGWPFTNDSSEAFVIKQADHSMDPSSGYTTSIQFFATVPPAFKKPS